MICPICQKDLQSVIEKYGNSMAFHYNCYCIQPLSFSCYTDIDENLIAFCILTERQMFNCQDEKWWIRCNLGHGSWRKLKEGKGILSIEQALSEMKRINNLMVFS